jgi:hypothetical protein
MRANSGLTWRDLRGTGGFSKPPKSVDQKKDPTIRKIVGSCERPETGGVGNLNMLTARDSRSQVVTLAERRYFSILWTAVARAYLRLKPTAGVLSRQVFNLHKYYTTNYWIRQWSSYVTPSEHTIQVGWIAFAADKGIRFVSEFDLEASLHRQFADPSSASEEHFCGLWRR